MLDVDLLTFMNDRDFIPLQMSEIRTIAQQLQVALDALKGEGILHCDIKSDNMMFTDLEQWFPKWGCQPPLWELFK
uniref:Protein kinase domain-containing protein n=1 Tax=Knipowitschia caucasica TaxID=637954 RepID=A0AAV2K6K3_KNICA